MKSAAKIDYVPHIKPIHRSYAHLKLTLGHHSSSGSQEQSMTKVNSNAHISISVLYSAIVPSHTPAPIRGRNKHCRPLDDRVREARHPLRDIALQPATIIFPPEHPATEVRKAGSALGSLRVRQLSGEKGTFVKAVGERGNAVDNLKVMNVCIVGGIPIDTAGDEILKVDAINFVARKCYVLKVIFITVDIWKRFSDDKMVGRAGVGGNSSSRYSRCCYRRSRCWSCGFVGRGSTCGNVRCHNSSSDTIYSTSKQVRIIIRYRQ